MKLKALDQLIVRYPAFQGKYTFEKEDVLTFYQQEEVQEALFISSENLHTKLLQYLNKPQENEAVFQDILIPLTKYAIRMNSRSTPFGLFSGCGVLDTHAFGNLEKEINQIEKSKVCRLDYEGSVKLIDKINSLESCRPFYKLMNNPSIYQLNERQNRYIENERGEKKQLYKISEFERDEVLDLITKLCDGGILYSDLLKQLAEEIEADEFTLKSYVDSLIEHSILRFELQACLSWEKPVDKIWAYCESVSRKVKSNELGQILTQLAKIKEAKELIKLENGDKAISAYNQIKNAFAALDLDIKRTVQLDTKYEFENEKIEEDEVHFLEEQVQEALNFFLGLNQTGSNQNIETFKQQFSERYGDTRVSLLEAIDSDLGIGYDRQSFITPNGNTLLKGLAKSSGNEKVQFSNKDFMLHEILEKHKKRGDKAYIQLDEKNLKNRTNFIPSLPKVASCMFRLIEEGEQRFIKLSHVDMQSPNRLIGRFGNNNEAIKKLMLKVSKLEDENLPDFTLAEILHLPSNKMGNVMQRPSFRQYEIEYLSPSLHAEKKSIQLKDLDLYVENNQLLMCHKVSGEKICPMISSAGNHKMNSTPVFRFLAEFHQQFFSYHLGFSWGNLERLYSSFPRLMYKNIIISAATWKINEGEIKNFKKQTENKASYLLGFCLSKGIPSSFFISQGDNNLYIDLRNALSCQIFEEELKKSKQLKLSESFLDEKYNTQLSRAEFIAFFENLSHKPPVKHQEPVVYNTQAETKHEVGSKWLYFKIYCSHKNATTILNQAISPIVNQFAEESKIDQWFFIRYSDPKPHLRVRFHMTDKIHIGDIIVKMHQFLLEGTLKPLVSDFKIDSYVPELNRYGFNNIKQSEWIFYIDSNSMLPLFNVPMNDEILWKTTLKAVDDYLDCFQLDLEGKMKVMNHMAAAYEREFNISGARKDFLNDAFREHKIAIESILMKQGEGELDPLIREYLDLRKRDLKLATLAVINNDHREIDLLNLIPSYVHMLVNRMVYSNQRRIELFIYSALSKTYKSIYYRQKNKQKAKQKLETV